jgi:hypothetical protein
MASLAQFDFKFRRSLGLGSPCGNLPEQILAAVEAKQIQVTDSAYSVMAWSPGRPFLRIHPLQRLEFGWWAEALHMPLVTVGDLVRLMDLIDRRFENAEVSGPAQRLQ